MRGCLAQLLAGTWYYRFYSTGTGQAAGDDQTMLVKASRFD